MTDVALLTAYPLAGESAPLTLDVLINDAPAQLVLLQKLRALPGKRAVYKAQWNNQNVLIKLFAGEHAARDMEREEQGITALREANIPTPALLAEARLANTNEPLLIIEFLESAIEFEKQWENASDDQKPLLLKVVMNTIAHHHQYGLFQKDIHLGNFLVSDHHIITIDGGAIDITHVGEKLPLVMCIDNLALFFAQWPLVFDQWLEPALVFYCDVTHSDIDLVQMKHKIAQCRQTRWQHYEKKIFRTCSEFVCEHTFEQFRVCRRDYMTPTFTQWLNTVEAELKQLTKPLRIKNGFTTVVGRLDCEGRHFIVKRYNIKSVWHAFSRFFRNTRAWDAWRNGYLLRFFGIATPLPVALIEHRIGPLRGVAFLITEAIDGLPLDKAMAEGANCVDEVVAEIHYLAAARISHGDMKANNFMVSGKQVYLIDLDATKQHHSVWFFKRAFAADIERFMRNWEQLPEVEAAFKNKLKQLM